MMRRLSWFKKRIGAGPTTASSSSTATNSQGHVDLEKATTPWERSRAARMSAAAKSDVTGIRDSVVTIEEEVKAAGADADDADEVKKDPLVEQAKRRWKLYLKLGGAVFTILMLVLLLFLLISRITKITLDIVTIEPAPADVKRQMSSLSLQAAAVASFNGPFRATLLMRGPYLQRTTFYDVKVLVRRKYDPLFTIEIPGNTVLPAGEAVLVNATMTAQNLDAYAQMCGASMLVQRVKVQFDGQAGVRGWRGMFWSSVRSYLGDMPCIPLS